MSFFGDMRYFGDISLTGDRITCTYFRYYGWRGCDDIKHHYDIKQLFASEY